MNHFPIGSAVWLAFFCLAPADPPKIEIAAETPVYVPVTVKVVGGAAKSSSLIEVPGSAWERRLDKHSSEFTGAPGAYEVSAFYVEIDKDGNPSIIKLKAKTKIVGAAPTPVPPNPSPPGPGPGPGPGPTPPPGPVSPSKIWIVVVEETSLAAANRGAIFGDPSLNAYMQSKGHKWRIVDKDVKGVDGQPPTDVKRFLDRAAGRPYPSVFLVDEKGVVRGELRLGPEDTAANVLNVLKKMDGSN